MFSIQTDSTKKKLQNDTNFVQISWLEVKIQPIKDEKIAPVLSFYFMFIEFFVTSHNISIISPRVFEIIAWNFQDNTMEKYSPQGSRERNRKLISLLIKKWLILKIVKMRIMIEPWKREYSSFVCNVLYNFFYMIMHETMLQTSTSILNQFRVTNC